MTPEEARKLLDDTSPGPWKFKTDVADLRTEWVICRLVYQGGKFLKPLYDYWSSETEGWQYFPADATWFDSQLDAEEEAERHGLGGYYLATRFVGPVEVVE